MPPNNLRYSETLTQPSKIIVAPPFNVKLSSSDQRGGLSEDIYLSLAINWVTQGGRIVAIVPEGFLFSQGSRRKELRQYMLTHTSIKAIFGLDAFMPNTSVRASILVLDKHPVNSFDNVLMGRIYQSDVPTNTHTITSCLQIPHIAQLLEAFHLQDIDAAGAAKAWLVSGNDLVAENLTVDRYSPSKQGKPLSTYTTVRLGDIVDIFKGSKLTLEENGDLFVVGPAAVRKLSIDVAKLDRTNKLKLPNNPVVTKANDIVINALSTYRGQAALVEQELAGYYVSRNIIVVRTESAQLSPAYLAIALNSTFVTHQLLERTTGSVIPQITKNALLEVQVPVPSLEEQKQIISRVTSAYHEILVSQQMLHEYEDRLDQAEENLNAMLEHLHSGGGLQ
ncbi:restriction endonuclease subunit S [Funiculus sociatus]